MCISHVVERNNSKVTTVRKTHNIYSRNYSFQVNTCLAVAYNKTDDILLCNSLIVPRDISSFTLADLGFVRYHVGTLVLVDC